MKTRFAQLARAAGVEATRGGDTEISAVVLDSRQAGPDACFVAIRGFETDGHKYIPGAVERGAAAVIYDDPACEGDLPPTLACARVPDSRQACASVAAEFHGHPSRELTIVGVTGTNGKTTTVQLAAAVIGGQGHSTAALGTLGLKVGGAVESLAHTTPEATDLQRAFADLRDRGVSHVAMEVSAHAIALHRVAHIAFDVACFTNLSQDHLDFFPSMDAYLNEKARLFTEYPAFARPGKDFRAVLNLDDPAGREILNRVDCPTITYGIDAEDADLRAKDAAFTARGTRFIAVAGDEREEVELRLAGRFNILNALAAAATGLALGYPLRDIARDLASVSSVPGRFEAIDEGQSFLVACDYAHTPDGLVNVLSAAQQVTEGRLVCIFGCGGDRDRTKRPLMAQAVCDAADTVIVTSDNPRSEDPLAIIADIENGLREDRSDVHIEPDRRAAIDLGVALCEPGDTLMVCGKGHEDVLHLAHGKIHFDDREEARRALRERLARGER